MTFNCIISDTEFLKFCPSSFNVSLEDEAPFMFYPKNNIAIVDGRSKDGKFDLIFPGRTIIPDLVPLEKLVSVITDSTLFLVDYKKGLYVLDLEHDVAHTWYTEPNQGYEDCLIFSGDGRRVIYNTYTQAKISCWGLNIIQSFDLTTFTNDGRGLIMEWVEKEIGERLIYGTREIFLRYFTGYSGTVSTEFYDAFNFSKLSALVKKIKTPTTSQPPLLLPEGQIDVCLINGQVPISCLIGMTGFTLLKGLDITFDLPMEADILSGAIDSLGNIILHQTLGGKTTPADIAEDFQLPVEKLLLIQQSLKGD